MYSYDEKMCRLYFLILLTQLLAIKYKMNSEQPPNKIPESSKDLFSAYLAQ